MRKCPECENMVPEDAAACPECGYANGRETSKVSINSATEEVKPKTKKNKLAFVAIKTVAVLAIAGISFAAGMAFAGGDAEAPQINAPAPSEDKAIDDTAQKEMKTNQSGSEFSVEWVEGTPEQFGGNGSKATPGEARIVTSNSGECVLTINFTYTNESEDAKNFINDMHCRVTPYQGGVELETPGVTSEAGAWDYSEAFTGIKKGGDCRNAVGLGPEGYKSAHRD